MTKKAAREHKARWNAAIAEGRIVNYGGSSWKEFTTAIAAAAAVADADDVHVFIVQPSRAAGVA